MRPPILLTAFEPFGTEERPNRGANASEEVLRAFVRKHPGRVETVLLPVNEIAETFLQYAIEEEPRGIISMGEADVEGEWDTNLEPCAEMRPVATGAPEGEAPRLASAFAPSVDLVDGLEREERIGQFWCNRAYWRVLEWTEPHHRPGAFLHLRVEGNRERQLEHLEHVIAAMEKSIGL